MTHSVETRQALKLIERMQRAGLTFQINDQGYIRSRKYMVTERIGCCPLNALYRHETGEEDGNMAVAIWATHFQVPEVVIYRIMRDADQISQGNPIRQGLLALVNHKE